MVKLFLHVVHI